MRSNRLALDDADRAMLAGEQGPAMQLAIETVLRAAEIMAAEELVPVSFAHIDACFYNGQAHIDFAQFLLDHGARFPIPAWTNNGLVSLATPDVHGPEADPELVEGGRKLMRLYAALGCKTVWTCAPYQLPGRPALGDHIVAGESNAVSFYNSVIGARTNKYGDYLDVACALAGKAPLAGLHRDEGRRGQVLFRTGGIADAIKRQDIFFHLLGYHVGKLAGKRIPVIDGLPADSSEDSLKAVSAAVAASGGVELWHGVGITPEARSFDAAFGGNRPGEVFDVATGDLAKAMRELSTARDGRLDMVALGTPHFSFTEFAALTPLLAGRRIHPDTRVYISTSRFIRDLAAAKGWIAELERAGVEIVVDTCTYFTPAVRGCTGTVMTNAAKWAYYAPGMLGVDVCFGSLAECAESAVHGEVRRDPDLWKQFPQ